MGVFDKEDKTGGSDDGVAGAAGGDDIRGVNSQAVANTLWVFTTMGTNPGKWMMGQLEGWTEEISGEFNSEDVPNTLWTLSFFRVHFNLSF